ncbi:MAG: DUF1638 domain-containing protein [Hyphomicrobiaceae bacterium]
MSEKRALIIACGALVREIRDVLGANRLSAIDIAAIPALYHNRPEKIAPAVAERIASAGDRYDHIFVAYADCGTGGDLDRVIDAAGVERLPGTHCYAFFSGVEAFAARDDDMTSFFLTDFLVRQFDSLIVKGLGIDRHPELRDMYFGNYEKVVYISQTPTEDLLAKARSAAVKLDLAFEHRPVGYGDLAVSLDAQFPAQG